MLRTFRLYTDSFLCYRDTYAKFKRDVLFQTVSLFVHSSGGIGRQGVEMASRAIRSLPGTDLVIRSDDTNYGVPETISSYSID